MSSFFTPSPFQYATPSVFTASMQPPFADFSNSATAFLSSFSTPSPLRKASA